MIVWHVYIFLPEDFLKGFELRLTDKEITAWGGIGLMKRILDRIGFSAALADSELPQQKSNRGFSLI